MKKLSSTEVVNRRSPAQNLIRVQHLLTTSQPSFGVTPPHTLFRYQLHLCNSVGLDSVGGFGA